MQTQEDNKTSIYNDVDTTNIFNIFIGFSISVFDNCHG